MLPATTYFGDAGHCRVTTRLVSLEEEKGVLELTVENLGEQDLILYNPFFHRVSMSGHVECEVAKMLVFDEGNQFYSDMLAKKGVYMNLEAVAPCWLSLKPHQSWTGQYPFPSGRLRKALAEKVDVHGRINRVKHCYIQVVFLDRFLSSDPTGRPPLPIDGDYSDSVATANLIGPSIAPEFPPIKAWLDSYDGREIFRSNAIEVHFDGLIRLADDAAKDRQ